MCSAQQEPAFVTLAVDGRLELLGTVQAAALGKDPPEPWTALGAALAEGGGHSSVRWYSAFLARGLSESRLAEFVLHLKPGFEFSGLSRAPAGLREELGGDRSLKEFAAAMRDLAERTHFTRLFAETRAYDRRLEAARGALARDVSTSALAAYLGSPPTVRLELLLAPGFSAKGFSIARRGEPGGGKAIEARFLDDSGGFSLDEPGSSATHALAHSVLDPLASRLEQALPEAGGLPEGCRTGRYSGGGRCFDEQLVMAVMLRLWRARHGEEIYRLKLRAAGEMGFPQLEYFLGQLERYEASRQRFPAIEAFLPELLAALRADAAAK